MQSLLHDAPHGAALLVDAETRLATLDLARYEVASVAVRAWRAPKSVATSALWFQRVSQSCPQTPALHRGNPGRTDRVGLARIDTVGNGAVANGSDADGPITLG